MKKKLLYPLLALAISASLTACGGGSTTSTTSSTSSSVNTNTSSSVESSADSSADNSADSSADGPTDAQLEAMTEAYNQVAVLYNDIATMANDNGWMADQETSDALDLIGATLEPIGLALTGDMSELEGADYDALPDALLALQPDLEAMAKKVAIPYEGSDDATADEIGDGSISDEDLQILTEVYNELAPLYNDLCEVAETNGWLADEQTVAELQALTELLTYIEAGVTEDPSMLEGTDVNEVLEQLEQELAPAIEELAEKVSVPYQEG